MSELQSGATCYQYLCDLCGEVCGQGIAKLPCDAKEAATCDLYRRKTVELHGGRDVQTICSECAERIAELWERRQREAAA